MFGFISFIVLIIIGFAFGRIGEARHFTDIKKREKKYRHKAIITTKTINADQVEHTEVASGSVVVSIDYFKQLVSSIRGFLGGEVNSLASLLDRAKREATLRMMESCSKADAYYNFKLETSKISMSSNGKNIFSATTIEVFVYATGVVYKKQ